MQTEFVKIVDSKIDVSQKLHFAIYITVFQLNE